MYRSCSSKQQRTCSKGAKVPQEHKFQGTKVLGTVTSEEQKFHGFESSMERKYLDFSLPTPQERKFHGSESSLWTFCSRKRKCRGMKSPDTLLYIRDYLINAISLHMISCLCLIDLSAAVSTWCGFLTVEQIGRINALLKQAYKYRFCSELFSFSDLDDDADVTLSDVTLFSNQSISFAACLISHNIL